MLEGIPWAEIIRSAGPWAVVLVLLVYIVLTNAGGILTSRSNAVDAKDKRQASLRKTVNALTTEVITLQSRQIDSEHDLRLIVVFLDSGASDETRKRFREQVKAKLRTLREDAA